MQAVREELMVMGTPSEDQRAEVREKSLRRAALFAGEFRKQFDLLEDLMDAMR
ncbi:MAG: hypothetical protein AAB403_14060 [Planctomycetota bacterium]